VHGSPAWPGRHNQTVGGAGGAMGVPVVVVATDLPPEDPQAASTTAMATTRAAACRVARPEPGWRAGAGHRSAVVGRRPAHDTTGDSMPGPGHYTRAP